MYLIDVVKKLVGPIEPIGDSGADKERLSNLQAMTALIDGLLAEVSRVGVDNAGSYEHSVKHAGKFANDFIAYVGREIVENEGTWS